MNYTLLVFLQAERVVTQLVRCSRRQRALHSLRCLLGGIASMPASAGDVIACDIQPVSGAESDLEHALERSIANVGQIVSKPVAGWDLEVRLGLAFSRLGVLPLENVRLSPPNLSAVAAVWVRERLHLDPAAQEVRWRMLGSGHMLVFCAPRSILDVFNALASRQNLRLKSFLPAALAEVLRKVRQRPKRGLPASRVLVWTESGAKGTRVAPVHMFHLRGRQLCTDWRGWLPQSAPNGHGDDALEGALARFLAANGATEAAVEYQRWSLADRIGAAAS